jgi:hypothetical protein
MPAGSVLALGRLATDDQADEAEAKECEVGGFIHLRADRLRKRSGGRGGEDQKSRKDDTLHEKTYVVLRAIG